MSHERSAEAERILMRIRASSEPAPGVANRVLEGVEQRVALGAALASGGNGRRELSPAVPPVSSGRHVWQVAARLGRWGAFGLVAGAIGYQLGLRAQADSGVPLGVATTPVVAPASESSSPAPVATSTTEPSAVPPAPDPPAAEPATTQPSSVSPERPPGPAGSAGVGHRSPSVPPRVASSSASRIGRARRAFSEAPGKLVPLALAEVLERLQRAQAELRDGDPHAALGELDALDALERGGVLVDERLVLRALAFCDIGRVGDARHVLAELDRLGAGSIYRGRLEQGCSAALEP